MSYKFRFEKVPFQSLLGASLLGCVLFGMFSGNASHPDEIHFIGAGLGGLLFCLSCWVKKSSF